MLDECSPLVPNTSTAFNGSITSDDCDSKIPQDHLPLHAHTKRLLTSRHVSMISIGGIIGTGLFMGIRQTLPNGPIISLVSYIYIATLCFYIIQAVAEMACYMPVNGSLCQFQFKFISNPIGVMNNFVYWLSWSITLALELSLIYEVLTFWSDDASSGGNFKRLILLVLENKPLVILFIWCMLTGANLLPVNYYGEIEFFVTSVKVGFIISWICLSIALILQKGNGFRYWNKEWVWGVDTIDVVKNPLGNKIINILSSSLVSSCFTFQSIESVALCSGEIHNIHYTLPKSIKYIVLRIVIFYILTLFLLTLMIPSNDQALLGKDDQIFSSPFLIGLINCGMNLGIVLSIFNLVILVSMLSAANSNIYFGSRCLLSMVEEGYFWSIFGKTVYKGVPVYSILLTSSIGLLSLVSELKGINTFYKLLINLSATAGLLMWLFILISYLRFRKSLERNGESYQSLVYNSPIPMVPLSKWAISSICVIILSNGMVNFWNFQWDSFLSCYLTLIIVVIGSVLLSIKWHQPLFKSL